MMNNHIPNFMELTENGDAPPDQGVSRIPSDSAPDTSSLRSGKMKIEIATDL
jgi:hypothetical protein